MASSTVAGAVHETWLPWVGTKSYSDGSLLPALPLHGSKELHACKPQDVCARAQLTRSACSVNLELSGRAGQAAYT